MVEVDWQSAEDLVFEGSQEIIRQFAHQHPGDVFSLAAFTVDSDYAGIALNFDTLENSLAETRRTERYQIEYRNRLFASDRAWRDARYFVAHFTNRIVDWNQRGCFKYDLIGFVKVPVWESYFASSEEGAELEGRVIVCLWRVVDRLVAAKAFDELPQAAPFRIAFSFHDDEMIVLRILNWPEFR